MKYGFYLSPCGEHIIEIWSHDRRKRICCNVSFGRKGYWWHMLHPKLEVVFSCWIYLGE